jgi:hypothetical protein
VLYLTGEVDNGGELTGMEVDGDEEQHLSKTDQTDALSPQNHKTKHPLQTL